VFQREREYENGEREIKWRERDYRQGGRKVKRGTVFVRFDIINRLHVNPATSIERFII
jgi:hypothetical protein